MNVYDTANRLAGEIKESEEYMNYKMAKQSLNLNHSLKEKMAKFEKLRYEVQLEMMQTGKNNEEKYKEIQAKTMELIYDDIKEKDYVDGKLFYELVEDMVKDEKCDAVILGCTELSLAQEREPITDLPIIDSQSVLVDKTLELALKTQKNK